MPTYRRKLGYGWLLAAVALFLTAPAHSAEDAFMVRATGYADGKDFSARKAAIEDARREAVVGVIHAKVAPDALTHLRTLLLNAGRYVERYDLLRHDIVEDSTRVEIDAYVNEEALDYDIVSFMLPRLPAPPTVLLLIGEQIADDKVLGVPDLGVAEVALREGLEERGLEVLGADSLNALYSHPELVETVVGGAEAGAEFARANLVDVVVVGSAVTNTTEGGEGSGLLGMHRANVNLRVFRAHDGKIIDALSSTAVIHGRDIHAASEEAVSDACKKLVGPLTVATVITVLGTQRPDSLLLQVLDPQTREAFERIIAVLSAEPSVTQVEELFYSPQLGRLRLSYEGDLVYLVELLTPKLVNGRVLDVRRAVGREMVLFFE